MPVAWPLLSPEVIALADALLIGLLIGAQREATRDVHEPGLRDYLLIALTGAVCGLLTNWWLTVAALVSITVFLVVLHRKATERHGITSELAAVSTFCLGLMAASASATYGPAMASALAIVMTFVLGSKQAVERFFRQTLTLVELWDTVKFLALIFVVYPLLPAGAYGPYGGIAPRQVWLFVILVSSISYAGYFLKRFLGERRGLLAAAVLGGLASTTAATLALARACALDPERRGAYWQAVTVANIIQLPRLLVILAVFRPELAVAFLLPFAVMAVAGALVAVAAGRAAGPAVERPVLHIQNPFELRPALQFGLLFAVILLVSKAATAQFGPGAVHGASLLGGLLDTDAVVVSVADLLGQGNVLPPAAALAVLLAVVANAVTKTALAAYAAGRALAARLGLTFAAMFAAGFAAL